MKQGLKSISYINPKIETALLSKESNSVSFSQDKINVIIGPNGSGKSMLLKHLATRYMCIDRGYTSLDRNITDRSYEKYFSKESWWGDYTFMKDIVTMSANCAAVYWSPDLKYGGWDMDTAAMMSGYSEEAKLRWEHTRNKSSGQGIYNQLDYIFDILEEERTLKVKIPTDKYYEEYIKKLKAVSSLFKKCELNKTVVLLDEPEQSLDAFKQLEFWNRLMNVNLDNIQIIIATHSLYPIISQQFKHKINFIETVCDYKQSVTHLFNRTVVN